jgi:hypothetical protein
MATVQMLAAPIIRGEVFAVIFLILDAHPLLRGK